MRVFTLIIAFSFAVVPTWIIGMPVPKPFGCKNSLISDEWREFVLNFHNDNRRKLSMGELKSKGDALAKPAQDMNEMVWDCDLEHLAWTGTCDYTTSKYGIFRYKYAMNKTCNATVTTREFLNKFWDEVKLVDLSATQNYGNNYRHFAHMANAKNKGFACTYRACDSTNLTVLCIYDKKISSGTIYTAAADSADICKCQNNRNDCVRYLCQYEYEPVGDQSNRPCSAKDGMTADLHTIAVRMHNYYRRLVATGWAKDKKIGYAPTAKNMLELKYVDCTPADTLAAETKTKVTGCPSTAPQASTGHSLNYYYVNRYDIPREQLLHEAITKWANQVAEIGVGKDNIFDPNGGVTNYANMVHDQVTKIACAVEVCTRSGNSAVACQYNAAPIEGDPIYVVGKPCKCTDNRVCSKLQGLCVLPS